jgi:hypothetical protein
LIAPAPSAAIWTPGGVYSSTISVTLDPRSSMVDVAFLIDDSASLAGEQAAVQQILADLASDLLGANPTTDFAFAVARFEDYGGLSGFSGDQFDGRPFVLIQPTLTASLAGGLDGLRASLAAALTTHSPGSGGDAPESVFEALYQIATGAGFDGDGNGSSLDSGRAGSPQTIAEPGGSGDVPPFATFQGVTAGTEGGVGWRSGSTRIVIVVADETGVAAFPSTSNQQPIVGIGGHTELSSIFSHQGLRFGPVASATNSFDNNTPGAVVPAGGATIQMAVDALLAGGIRVLGLAPGGGPSTSTTPSSAPSGMLSALARLTGSASAPGSEPVFDLNSPTEAVSGLATSVRAASARTTDLMLRVVNPPSALWVVPRPARLNGVEPGATADFHVALAAAPGFAGGSFAIEVLDAKSGAKLGEVPVRLTPPTPAAPVPPTIRSLVRLDQGRQATRLMLTFSEELNVATAQAIRNYRLVDRMGRVIPIRSVSYQADSRLVIVRVGRRLDARAVYFFGANGDDPGAIRSLAGALLHGAGNGLGGSDWIVRLQGNRVRSAAALPQLAASRGRR